MLASADMSLRQDRASETGFQDSLCPTPGRVALCVCRDTIRSMKVYRVRIYYREPTYEERAGSKDRPYRGAFTVEAADEGEAREKALEEFKRMERLSGVG